MANIETSKRRLTRVRAELVIAAAIVRRFLDKLPLGNILIVPRPANNLLKPKPANGGILELAG
jgi:hypothetical protein